MAISETLAVLIINNAFILVGGIVKYLADSNCTRFICCKGAVEVEDLRHMNSELKKQADMELDTMTSTVNRAIPMSHGQEKK